MPPGFGKEKIAETIIGVSAWAGLAIQLYILLINVPENGLTHLQAVARFLSYFTILTNLLVAISLAIRLVNPHSRAAHFFSSFSVHTAIGLYILAVGLGYNLLLRQLWKPEGLQKIADELLHVLTPGLYFLYWLIIRKKEAIKWKSLLLWLLYPILYLCYALIRGLFENWYPYFFIDVTVLGYGGVVKYSIGLLAVFIVLGTLFIFMANNGRRKKEQY